MTETTNIALTAFAHGAGCGCKLAPQVLETILSGNKNSDAFASLLVGNNSNDDAAVMLLNQTEALISTTDFFTPIVDDAYVFGQVASANAISDVYAMGGKPMMALAILGWPIEKIPAEIAQKVIEGAKAMCSQAGIPLAGGHSIDTPEPVFGLAVTGIAPIANIKKNNTAKSEDLLLLTKPIGVGILATAAKRKLLQSEEHLQLLHQQLTVLNNIGEKLGAIPGVTAMTDVTGFGLLGHLIEMSEGSGLSATISYQQIPKIPEAATYLAQRIVPDATYRNWNGYNAKVKFESGVNVMEAFQLLPDPQTNGGLLIAVNKDSLLQVQQLLERYGYASYTTPIGFFTEQMEKIIYVNP